MLELKLKKRFEAFALELECGSDARVLGITGPSGSGKTTVLNCLAGVLRPDEGRIVADGTVLFDSLIGANVPVRRRGVGYVFQDSLLFPHLTVRSNLTFGEGAHGPAPSLSDVAAVLELEKLFDRYPVTLSGGEARRVSIGRALLTGPRWLLLDEPLAGLDRQLAGRTLGYLKRVLETFDVRAVYVSHLISDVIFLCDEAWVLSGGRLAATGPPRQVVARSLPTASAEPLQNLFVAMREAPKVQPGEPSPGQHEGVAIYRVGEQRLHVAASACAAGGRATLAVASSDILLARARPDRISARNVLRGRVVRLARYNSQYLVFIDVGVEWMVTLTAPAVAELELAPGVELFVIVKASSISVLHAAAIH